MAVVASKHIFGGGLYSTAGSAQLRMVGSKKWPVSEIAIAKPGPGHRGKDGVYRPGMVEPYMPKSMRDPFHPSGNSACYMIQTAHLMGCDPIYLLGFTFASGTGYFFGLTNPVTNRRSFYLDGADRARHWLMWYQERYPGRAKLWPGWQGPIYETLETLDEDEAARLSGGVPRARHQPEEVGGDDEAVQRL